MLLRRRRYKRENFIDPTENEENLRARTKAEKEGVAIVIARQWLPGTKPKVACRKHGNRLIYHDGVRKSPKPRRGYNPLSFSMSPERILLRDIAELSHDNKAARQEFHRKRKASIKKHKKIKKVSIPTTTTAEKLQIIKELFSEN